MQLTEEQIIAINAAISISFDIEAERHDGSFLSHESVQALKDLLAAHNAGAQEPVAYTSADRLKRITERNRHVDTMWPASMRDEGDIPLYAHPQPLTQTDAARDVKRYHGRTIEDLKEICTTRPARYPQAHHDFDKTILALIAEIERLDRAKGE